MKVVLIIKEVNKDDVTKYYCDRCKKEINYINNSIITIESESRVVAQKIDYLTIPGKEFLFGFDKQSFMLCQKCSRIFKKYWDQYMKEI